MTVLPISDILLEEIRNIGIDKRRFVLELVKQQWDDIVGKEIAAVTYVYDVGKNLLRVRVKDACWKQELSLRKADIIKAIEKRFGAGVVEDIVFNVGRIRKRRFGKDVSHLKKRSLSSEERKWIKEVSSLAGDSSLQSVIERTLESYLAYSESA